MGHWPLLGQHLEFIRHRQPITTGCVCSGDGYELQHNETNKSARYSRTALM